MVQISDGGDAGHRRRRSFSGLIENGCDRINGTVLEIFVNSFVFLIFDNQDE